ncbi:universal stress protein [Neobacillus niacini]|uniref:universal stress protein n=1 Tax=Neobacillus niacini TaxID=86668 RepID=UPI003F68ACCA
MAINLAKQDKVIQLLVVTVMQPVRPLPYSSYGYALALNRESQDKEFEEIRKELEEELKTLPNKSKLLLLEGQPGQMIVEFVKENDADLVVMGSRGLSGLKELFLGSVSHYVVQKAPCPVFIVK